MHTFQVWLETKMTRLPLILRGLAAEARKAGSYENFQRDFLGEIKHGLYWHWTGDPSFQINSELGPRDMSTMATNTIDRGALMISSNIDDWSMYGPEGKGRAYCALIDMTQVPRNAYRQVNRGFGNEFYVSDPSRARVIEVLTRQKAFAKNRRQRSYLEAIIHSVEDLQAFYDNAIKS